MAYIFPALTFLLGIILSVFFQILLNEPVYLLVSKLIPRYSPKKKRNINGIWKCVYRYPSKGNYMIEKQVMSLRQIGPFVSGDNLFELSHKHRIIGKFTNGKYFTGTWENVNEGDIWKGAFQFVLNNRGDKMKGKWIGFDSHDEVMEGNWSWKLIKRKNKNDIDFNNLDYTNLIIDCSTDYEKVKKIVDIYIQAWTQQNKSFLKNIFTRDATYREYPFERPYMGLKEIEDYWESKVVKMQANITCEVEYIYVEGNFAVVEWEAKFYDIEKSNRKHMKEVALLTIRGNKISSLREYWAARNII